MVLYVFVFVFFFKQKTAYEMRISDWSSDVCSSDLSKDKVENLLLTVSTTDDNGVSAGEPGFLGASRTGECRVYFNNITPVTSEELYDQAFERLDAIEIGRASCRERVCQYV